ncbi:MAG: hypothetical protein PHW57_03655 [Candidatus Shapirobacteria bacterium]|nr:hypothetical protein [Candidatus Shapirobacteria bacterium]
MTEGGNMPGPEQRPPTGPEQAAQNTQDVFINNLRVLIEPQREIDPQGRETERPAQVQIFFLKKLAERAIRNPRANDLASEIDRINNWLAEKTKLVDEGKLEEQDYYHLEDQALLLSAVISEEFYRQSQELRVSEFAQDIDPFLGAVFLQGKYNAAIENGQIRMDKNIILDVENPEDRDRWLHENIRVIMRRINVSEPEKQWKAIADMWRSEFAIAADRAGMNEETFKDFDMKIRSAMGVSSSARAMEHSNGSTERYVSVIAGPGAMEADLDVADDWREYLLHEKEDKLVTILEDPLVERYYRKILDLAGINIPELFGWQYRGRRLPVDEEGQALIPFLDERILRRFRQNGGVLDESALLADIETEKKKVLAKWDEVTDTSRLLEDDGRGGVRIRERSLVGYLSDEVSGGYKGGFPALIDEILLPEVDVSDLGSFKKSQLIGAARLAADAFLVEKYTAWEFFNNDGLGVWRPDPSWGGDPFRSILEPSFLTHKIKGMYHGPGSEKILEIINLAFRPTDVLDAIPTAYAVNEVVESFLTDASFLNSLSGLPEREIEVRARSILRRQLPHIRNILVDDLPDFSDALLRDDLGDNLSRQLVTAIMGGVRVLSGLPSQELTIRPSDRKINHLVLELRNRIDDILVENLAVTKARPLSPNALCHLKNYNRLTNEALWTFLGGSRGPKIPVWNEETIRDLPKVFENIDDVYKMDKDLVGLMFSRIILAKSLAAVLERAEPNLTDKVAYLFNPVARGTRPFYELEIFLWGPKRDGREGYLSQLMGPRTSVPLEENRYGAQIDLMDSQRVITYADRVGKNWEGTGYIIDALVAAGRNIH